MTEMDRIMRAAPGVRGLFDLSGKVALVVGGTRGLGQAMALALGGAGADVCVIGRGPAGLRETAEAIGSLGGRGKAIAAHVTMEKNVADALKETSISTEFLSNAVLRASLESPYGGDVDDLALALVEHDAAGNVCNRGTPTGGSRS